MINIGSHGTPGHVVAFFSILVGQYMHIVAEICGCFISGAHEPPKVDRSVYIHCVVGPSFAVLISSCSYTTLSVMYICIYVFAGTLCKNSQMWW